MKKLRLIRARAGFTLAEVLAAGALVAVILGMVSLVLLASVNGFARAAMQDRAKQLGLAVYDFYRDQMICARDISIDADAAGAQISVRSGRVFYAKPGEDPAPLYPDSMYAGSLVRVEIAEKNNAIYLSVDVSNDGTVLFSKQSAFRALTLERVGNAVFWAESIKKTAENPIVYVK